jgi:hypothetical protein
VSGCSVEQKIVYGYIMPLGGIEPPAPLVNKFSSTAIEGDHDDLEFPIGWLNNLEGGRLARKDV